MTFAFLRSLITARSDVESDANRRLLGTLLNEMDGVGHRRDHGEQNAPPN
jgi:hypothetical protein